MGEAVGVLAFGDAFGGTGGDVHVVDVLEEVGAVESPRTAFPGETEGVDLARVGRDDVVGVVGVDGGVVPGEGAADQRQTSSQFFSE